MQDQEIHQVIPILRETVKQWPLSVVEGMAQVERKPYQVLLATILSLRTKDSMTARIFPKLFALADTPEQMVRHSPETIAEVIYPVGFYHTKARQIVELSHILLDEYGGQVPSDLEALLKLPGVGRKTANLVLTVGFQKAGICVDVHVHRISNRWGYVQTKTPDKTELALRAKLPPQYWIEYNGLLVTFGQNLCAPTSPWCSRCPLPQFCARVGVTKRR